MEESLEYITYNVDARVVRYDAANPLCTSKCLTDLLMRVFKPAIALFNGNEKSY